MKIFRNVLSVLVIVSSLLFIYYFLVSFDNPSSIEEGKNYLYFSFSIYLILKTIEGQLDNIIKSEEQDIK